MAQRGMQKQPRLFPRGRDWGPWPASPPRLPLLLLLLLALQFVLVVVLAIFVLVFAGPS